MKFPSQVVSNTYSILFPSRVVSKRVYFYHIKLPAKLLDERGWVNLGCRLRASGICPIFCAYPLPKSPLRASIKMALLVARIGAQNDRCVSEMTLRASFFRVTKNQHLDPNIRNSGFYYRVFTTTMALTADTVRVQVA